ncbi:MAG: hypothetical protein ACI4TU_10415 [Candidatus Cryptobacteroides sp.]
MGYHMFLEKVKTRTILCLLSILVSFPTYAHPNSWQHIMEMYSVLPFATDKDGNVVQENFPIRIWLENITKNLIDDYNRVEINEYGGCTFYAYLQREFNFKLSFGEHRILFHWGYNAQPWNDSLEQYVISNNWDEEKIARFKRAMVVEQRRRNRIANKEAEKVFNFASGGIEAQWANAILSIVYDVHLLGDYTLADNKNFKGVTEPSKVAQDILSSIRRLDRSKTSIKLIESIKQTISEYSDQHILAEKLIILLQKEMPRFILSAQDGSLKRRFEKLGYKLK